MSPELVEARRVRGLPPYRREIPRWRYWTCADVALAALTTEGAVQQRARRGHFPGAVQVVGERRRWLIPDAAARAFITRSREGG